MEQSDEDQEEEEGAFSSQINKQPIQLIIAFKKTEVKVAYFWFW